MRLLGWLGLLFGLTASLIVPATALNREAFTITRYDLEVRLEPEQQRLGARGKITLRNDSAQPQKIVALQISSSLNWRSIRVDAKPVQYVSQPYISDIDHTGALSEAIVTLPAEIKPKDSVEVEIGYEGVIPLDATRLTRIGVPDEIAKHSSWDQISPSFTAVRGAGYVAWYPITTESADFSEGNSLFEVVDRWKAREAGSGFKARVTMSRESGEAPPLIICTPGAVATIEQFSRAQKVSAECSWTRLGTVTPTFAMANYLDRSKPPFYLFSFPGREEGATTYSNALEPAMKFVSGWFGRPTAPIAIADFADPNSAPFESGTLLMASMAAQDSKLAGINVVHELVHSALPSSKPWVYEGLAHFAEAMYRQEQGGRQAGIDLLGLHRAAFLDSEKEVSATLRKNAGQMSAGEESVGQPLASTFDETYYRSKAAYVWWMLRDMIGDDALKQAIRKYRAEGDNDKDKDPKYVEQLIESAAKRDLSWFFDDWVYQDRGLPDFHVQSVHPWKTEKGVQIVTVTLENLGNAGAEVPFTIMCEGGAITKRIEVRAKGTATTRVELPGTASEIVVNDGSVPESDLTNNVFQIGAQQK
ncbi:MAG TPA: M1 family aminopeptidase [Terriglobales bacterium]|nr:M1 family aminopeptidase [Terriglobales bacterium]